MKEQCLNLYSASVMVMLLLLLLLLMQWRAWRLSVLWFPHVASLHVASMPGRQSVGILRKPPRRGALITTNSSWSTVGQYQCAN